MAFHCIIVEKSKVEKSYHGGDYDLAMRKHFGKLIETKIGNVIKAHPDRECEFRVEVDPLPSRYKKADEAFEVITNHTLAKRFGRRDIIKSVVTKDSKSSEHIQIADANKVASYLGWDSLMYDTWPKERKFNIWLFFDRSKGPRDILTRDVNLKYELPKPKK